jgi:geranylgeranyl pyrophosphate synthase
VTVTGATPFEAVLSAAGERVRELIGQVEETLARVAAGHGADLAEPAGSTLAAGGKRLRPLLVLICGDAGQAQSRSDALVRAASAVELVHMATLVHDDVIDGALLRRGRPTVYAQAGRTSATATGDFLFSRAFSLLGDGGDREQVRALSGACLALARGELAQRRDRYARDVDVQRYLRRCELKTASLFGTACRLGALAAGDPPRRTSALGRFGQKLGLGFQILDDVLDVVGSPGETGKQRGTDLLEGTTTLRSVGTRDKAEQVCEQIIATGVLEAARAHAARLVTEAKAELAGAIDPEREALLRLAADRVVERYS